MEKQDDDGPGNDRAKPADHPFAAIFPLLDEPELKELAQSIARNGLKVPITLFEDKILDGRNRFRACLLANVEPVFVQYSGDSPLFDVVAWNLERRHLTATQRAAVALEVLPFYEEEARKRRAAAAAKATQAWSRVAELRRDGIQGSSDATDLEDQVLPEEALCEIVHTTEARRATAEAGAAFGANYRYVSDLKVIREEAPALFEQCKNGGLRVPQAKREIGKLDHAARVQTAKAAPKTAHWERHEIILADPPWQHEFATATTPSRQPENHYQTATLEEIAAHCPKSADEDSILFLWATAPLLPEALSVMAAWGFKYRTQAIWDKQKIGMGFWFRGQHEVLLVGTKGDPGTVPEPARRSSIFSEPRGAHSVKPQCVYSWIEEAFPLASKLEMYCRSPRPGWDAWGNEV